MDPNEGQGKGYGGYRGSTTGGAPLRQMLGPGARQWDRRILEVVVPADWLPVLDVQRMLRVTHRSKLTREAKTTTA